MTCRPRSRACPRARSALALALATVVTAGLAHHSVAGPPEAPASTWVGRRVMVRASGTPVKVGPEVTATLHAGSVVRVDRDSGRWLWISAGAVRGWLSTLR